MTTSNIPKGYRVLMKVHGVGFLVKENDHSLDMFVYSDSPSTKKSSYSYSEARLDYQKHVVETRKAQLQDKR
jgi:hypothetical protein